MRWPWQRTPLAAVRWVVVDCETSGLDPSRDRLLSAGNILVHGIGAEAQLGGQPAHEALAALRAFLGEGVPVAFHAAFDAQVLARAAPRRMPRRWLDLAALAPALYPRHAARCRALDEWLAEFGIAPLARHDALGDAFAAAQLLLVLLAAARRQGIATREQLEAAARDVRWLAP